MSNVPPTIQPCQRSIRSESFFPTFGFGKRWTAVLAESDLPNSVQTIISAVVRETRLMQFEKLAVTQELVSHFADGSQRGTSFDKLLADFGEPSVTGALIRRSKIRNRPMMMKLVRGMGWGAGILGAVYLGMLAFFHMGSPNPHVDYTAQLNEAIINVAENDKAWPIYRPLWTKYGFSEGGGFDSAEIFHGDPKDQAIYRLVRPGDSEWETAVEAMANWGDLLEAFRVGARRPALGLALYSDLAQYSDEDFAALYPGGDRPTSGSWFNQDGENQEIEDLMKGSVLTILLPHVQSFRKAARIFVVDTRIAVEQGDSDRAMENIKTIFGLAQQAAEGDVLVCSLVGYAVAGIGFETIEEVLDANPDFFSDGQLAEIQARIEMASLRDWLNYGGERLFFQDIVQRVYTDDNSGDGRMTPEGVKAMSCNSLFGGGSSIDSYDGYATVVRTAQAIAAPATLFLLASRKDLTDKYDQLWSAAIAEANIPYSERSPSKIESTINELPTKYQLIKMLIPATQQVLNAMDRTKGRQEAVLTALAFHRYRLKYGEWPKNYDQVSPEFIAQFPLDEIDGSLLKFKIDDNDKLLIYSVGNDRDDDGGQDIMTNGTPTPRSSFVFAAKGPSTSDGDWIVWPQRDPEN